MSDKAKYNPTQEAKDLYEKKSYKKCIAFICKHMLDATISDHDLIELYMLLGKSYLSIKMFNEAIVYLKKALHLKPKNSTAYFLIGNAYRDLKKFLLAADAYEQAIALDSNSPVYYLNLGGVYRTLEKYFDAVRCYRNLIKLKPDYPMGYRNLVQCVQYKTLDNSDFKVITKLLKNGSLSDDEKMHCHFALGKIHNDCNNYNESFVHLEKANAIRSASQPYHKDSHAKTILGIIDFFNPEFFLKNGKGLLSNQPVFIIGLPRSGKTLVQKILSCHDGINGVDEIGMIDALIYQLKGKHNLDRFLPDIGNVLTKENLIPMAHYYLDIANEPHQYASIKITDTTPCNYKYLGYIHLLFPRAKIIHIKRNPLDHCLQIYMKYFAEGNNYAFNMSDLIHYYKHYEKLMTHWNKVLPSEIFEVNYESIISDTEQVSSELLKFLEVDVTNEFKIKLSKLNIMSNEVAHWKEYAAFINILISSFPKSK
jgi:tetratricopeptide (TPR) repeat protein